MQGSWEEETEIESNPGVPWKRKVSRVKTVESGGLQAFKKNNVEFSSLECVCVVFWVLCPKKKKQKV